MKKTPLEKGESVGPVMVACQWNMSLLSEGPAEQLGGGSFCRSANSFMMRLDAMVLKQAF